MDAAMKKGIEKFIHPRSIAIIGASPVPGKLGHMFLENMIKFGFRGSLFPINPGRDEVLSFTSYPDVLKLVRETGEIPDLAYVCVPAVQAASSILDCVNAGIGAVVVTGSAIAADMQQEARVLEALHSSGTLLLGPNCLGVHCPASAVSFNAHISSTGGPVAFLSQSGSMTEIFVLGMRERGTGVGIAVSTGNEAMLGISDFVEYLSENSEIRVIAFYVEQLRDMERFFRVAASSDKKMVALVAGNTPEGRRAATLHTHAMVHSPQLYSSLFRKLNILEVQTFTALADTAAYLAKVEGGMERPFCVSAPGGLCVTLSDAIGRSGETLDQPSDEFRRELSRLLPEGQPVANPLDLTMAATHDLSLFSDASLLGERFGYDGTVIGAPTSYSTGSFVREITSLKEKLRGPLQVVWTGETERIREGMRELWENGIPSFPSPESFAFVSSAVRRHSIRAAHLREMEKPCFKTARGNGVILMPEDAQRVLSGFGIEVLPEVRVSSQSEALSAAAYTGFPVVLKVHSPHLFHKTAAGAVRTCICTPLELADAYHEMEARSKEFGEGAHVYLSRHIQHGVEFAVGGSIREGAPVLMTGPGGALLEHTAHSFTLCPVSMNEALELIEEGIEGRLLSDMDRGELLVSRFAQLLVGVSRLMMEEEIAGLDLNPVRVSPEGIFPVDVKVQRSVD